MDMVWSEEVAFVVVGVPYKPQSQNAKVSHAK